MKFWLEKIKFISNYKNGGRLFKHLELLNHNRYGRTKKFQEAKNDN